MPYSFEVIMDTKGRFVFLIYGIFLYGMFGESNIGTMNWNSGQAAANILI